jgi:hypothetical protein
MVENFLTVNQKLVKNGQLESILVKTGQFWSKIINFGQKCLKLTWQLVKVGQK